MTAQIRKCCLVKERTATRTGQSEEFRDEKKGERKRGKEEKSKKKRKKK